MSTTAFIVGFKKHADTITLQEWVHIYSLKLIDMLIFLPVSYSATVILYLLTLSSISIFFSLARLAHFTRTSRWIKLLSVIQYYFHFGLALAVLIVAGDGFGSLPLCNVGARVVIFRPFNMLPAGCIGFIIFHVIWIAFYTTMTFLDYHPNISNQVEAGLKHVLQGLLWVILRRHHSATDYEISSSASTRRGGGNGGQTASSNTTIQEVPPNNFYDCGLSGTLVFELFLIFTLWGIVVMNTELLVRWNRFKDAEDPQWQFGQVSHSWMLWNNYWWSDGNALLHFNSLTLDSCCLFGCHSARRSVQCIQNVPPPPSCRWRRNDWRIAWPPFYVQYLTWATDMLFICGIFIVGCRIE